eukprot:scaffold771_cov147-Skeletonema_menzelii.AAC.7
MTAVTVIESDWIRGQSSHHITARAVPPCAISHNILTCAVCRAQQADVNQKLKLLMTTAGSRKLIYQFCPPLPEHSSNTSISGRRTIDVPDA